MYQKGKSTVMQGGGEQGNPGGSQCTERVCVRAEHGPGRPWRHQREQVPDRGLDSTDWEETRVAVLKDEQPQSFYLPLGIWCIYIWIWQHMMFCDFTLKKLKLWLKSVEKLFSFLILNPCTILFWKQLRSEYRLISFICERLVFS